MSGEVPYDATTVLVSANAALGSINNSIFPSAFRLCASSILAVPLAPFTPDSLAGALDREVWPRDLGESITTYLQAAADPEDGAASTTAALEALGHELYRYEMSDQPETRATDHRGAPSGAGIRIELSYPIYEDPLVEVIVTSAPE